ncbi:hypothetical protein [Streptomyces hydrogenans]|uniref:hypothetical protein n=1 Tax=Streptomyces hydrogenans TaxID=1873719 RepID=UPI00342F98D2
MTSSVRWTNRLSTRTETTQDDVVRWYQSTREGKAYVSTMIWGTLPTEVYATVILGQVAHIIHDAWGVEAPDGFLTVVFAAPEWTGEHEIRETRKHSQVCWVDADAISEDFAEITASALDRYLNNGSEVSPKGWSTAGVAGLTPAQEQVRGPLV